eukprot:5690716-Pyramimonas_sp.AAC.2
MDRGALVVPQEDSKHYVLGAFVLPPLGGEIHFDEVLGIPEEAALRRRREEPLQIVIVYG